MQLYRAFASSRHHLAFSLLSSRHSTDLSLPLASLPQKTYNLVSSMIVLCADLATFSGLMACQELFCSLYANTVLKNCVSPCYVLSSPPLRNMCYSCLSITAAKYVALCSSGVSFSCMIELGSSKMLQILVKRTGLPNLRQSRSAPTCIVLLRVNEHLSSLTSSH